MFCQIFSHYFSELFFSLTLFLLSFWNYYDTKVKSFVTVLQSLWGYPCSFILFFSLFPPCCSQWVISIIPPTILLIVFPPLSLFCSEPVDGDLFFSLFRCFFFFLSFFLSYCTFQFITQGVQSGALWWDDLEGWDGGDGWEGGSKRSLLHCVCVCVCVCVLCCA